MTDRFERIAKNLIDALAFDSTAALDAAISRAETELTEARNRRAEYVAYRDEQCAVLELLGHAYRDDRGEWVISTRAVTTQNGATR